MFSPASSSTEAWNAGARAFRPGERGRSPAPVAESESRRRLPMRVATTPIEGRPPKALPTASVKRRSFVILGPSHVRHGSVSATGGNAAMWARRMAVTAVGRGTSRTLSPFGGAKTSPCRSTLTGETTYRVCARKSISSTDRPKISPLPQPAPSSEVHHRPELRRQPGPDRRDAVHRPRDDAVATDGCRAEREAQGFRASKPSSTTAERKRPGIGVDNPDVRRRQAGLLKPLEPLPDVGGLGRPQRARPEMWGDVQTESPLSAPWVTASVVGRPATGRRTPETGCGRPSGRGTGRGSCQPRSASTTPRRGASDGQGSSWTSPYRRGRCRGRRARFPLRRGRGCASGRCRAWRGGLRRL